MSQQELFRLALDYIKHLPTEAKPGQPQITNQDKLLFYGLFKQATTGQNKTKAPSRLKIVEKYKWDAWKKLGKMGKEEAMKSYVDKLSKIDPKWNLKPKL